MIQNSPPSLCVHIFLFPLILGFPSSVSWITDRYANTWDGQSWTCVRTVCIFPIRIREFVCSDTVHTRTPSVYLSESQDDIEPTLDSSSYGTWADWSVFYTSGSVPVIGAVHTTYTDFSDLPSSSFSSVFQPLLRSRWNRLSARKSEIDT